MKVSVVRRCRLRNYFYLNLYGGKMGNPIQHYDAVVIGAGNGGLTAATKLQRSGRKTLLLERHNIPGGCATSFIRGDYEFEVALHQLSGLGTDTQPFIMRQLFSDLGVLDKVEFVQEHELYRLVIPGQLDTTLPASWKGMMRMLQDDYPAEREAIERFFDMASKLTMENFLQLPHCRRANDAAMLQANCPTYLAYGLRPAQEVLDEFFADPKLISTIAIYWCYLGVPPSQLPFADLMAMLFAYCTFKPWNIRGGSQALSSALIDSFMRAGGEVRFNCGAEKILTEDSRVVGVRLESGETVTCDSVISNASPLITYNELLDMAQPPQTVREDFKSRRMGTSALVIYVGLDCPPEEAGITTASTFVGSTTDNDAIHQRMSSMEKPLFGMVTCYNFVDTKLVPAGKSLVSLVALHYGEMWRNIPPEDYLQTKYQQGELLLQLIETTFPKIREHIEELEVATPLTMMRYLNSPDGAIYGFKQNTEDNELFRERLQGVAGLYSAGSWVGMGGFQPAYMSGEGTARAALKYLQSMEASHV